MSKTPPLLTKDEMQEASARLRAYLRDAETVVRQKVEDVADALYGLER